MPASNRLQPCPSRPNCVCSLGQEQSNHVAPIHRPSEEETAEVLKRIVLSLPRSSLISESADYLHFLLKSPLFRFEDDLEFWFLAEASFIHVRSAARLGYFDFGVNRRRVERIRSRIADQFG